MVVGNAGDSRAVLSHLGVEVALSFDHKPLNPGEVPAVAVSFPSGQCIHSSPPIDESRRIIAAGGFVEFGRVNGRPFCC